MELPIIFSRFRVFPSLNSLIDYPVPMFSNRKRCFPPGVFISTPLRVIAILQLCIAFTILAAYAGYPFMGELYEIKARKVVYDEVMGSNFSLLPQYEQTRISKEHRSLQERLSAPAGERANRSLNILLFGIPPFIQAWILFSVAVSLLLLLKIEGAAHAAWVLPLVVFGYAIDNQMNGVSLAGDASYFPTEQVIVSEYLKEPLSGGISSQRDQLLRGWRLYLINEWANEEPSSNTEDFLLQAQVGEFYFNVSRLPVLSTPPGEASFYTKRHPLALFFFLVWNLIFAWFINRFGKYYAIRYS